MKKLLLLLFFVPLFVSAEELKMEWQKGFGGNLEENIEDSILVDDGIVIIGYTYSTDIDNMSNKGDRDALIIKYDFDGNILWKNNFGGSLTDWFSSVFQIDNGYVVFGFSQSHDIDGLSIKGYQNMIIVKYDKNGNLVWQNSFGSSSNNEHIPRYIQTDDGFIILCYSDSTEFDGLTNHGGTDAIIVKIDNDGNFLWMKNFGGNETDIFYDAVQVNDDIYAIGYYNSTDIEGVTNKGDYDGLVLKYNKDGNIVWKRSFGGSNSDVFLNLTLDDDGIIVNGYFKSTDILDLSNNGKEDAIILKYDFNGNLLWNLGIGGNNYDSLNDIYFTRDKGNMFHVTTQSTDIDGIVNENSQLYFMVKYDSNQNLLWKRQFLRRENIYSKVIYLKNDSFVELGYSLLINDESLTSNGGYDALVVKYDKDGNVKWKRNWGGSGNDMFYDGVYTKDEDLILFAISNSSDVVGINNKGNFDTIIVKYDKDGNLLWQTSWGGNKRENYLDNVFKLDDDTFITIGCFSSDDIDNLSNKGGNDIVVVKYSIEYDLENITTENGKSTLEQRDKYGVISTIPDKGYEVDKIIIKDKNGNVLDVKVNKQDDGKYSFELFSDVSVEVSFKRVFNINKKETINGDAEIIKNGNVVFVKPLANKGYEIDKIIIKNSKNEEVKINKLEDGTYSFELSDDVSVEVLFKEEIFNPKTGVINILTTLVVGFIFSFVGYIIVKNKCYEYEL